MAFYTKPYLPLSDQLALIKSRGLQVADDADAIKCLHRNGYYRLSAYWFPFRKIVNRKKTDVFLDNSRFEDAVALYRFDKTFKMLLLDAIERVEIAVRVEVALVLGRQDAFAYMKPSLFRRNFSSSGSSPDQYPKWIAKFNSLYQQSHADFVIHHKNRYGVNTPIPIWIAIELWNFGMLSYAFSGMRYRDQVAVAARFAILDWRLMANWLQRLNYIRNVIAHHGRLWNLDLSSPQFPHHGAMPDFDVLLMLPNAHTRIYAICCILCYFTHVINPNSTWVDDLRRCIRAFPAMPHAGIQAMGFPSDWESHRIWR